ncbi:MAG TPA: hypothetical protein VGM73_09215 [Candidatus Didemnitutus sp.]|jgi:hypothetical protein
MRRLLLALFVAFPTCGLWADSLAFALQARAMVGPEHWSRVIEIERRVSHPHHPPSFHALLFELEDRLWLYDSNEGTQSLSLFAGRLAQDEADPTELLRAALPHFSGYRDVTADVASLHPAAPKNEKIPFGCFIECVARWRGLRAAGTSAEFAGILAIYFDSAAGSRGHSVLIYGGEDQPQVFDPEEGSTTRLRSVGETNTPLQIARTLYFRANPTRARLLALHPPEVAIVAHFPTSSRRSS